MPLHLDLDLGETVRIGESTVSIEHKTGQRVRISVAAPPEIPIEIVRNPQERGAKFKAHECRHPSETTRVKHPV